MPDRILRHSFLCSLPLFLFVFFDLKDYFLWQQVTVLWPHRLGGFFYYGDLYIHAPRYALTYWIFGTASLTGMSYDELFTFLVPFLLFGTVLFSAKTVLLLSNTPKLPFSAFLILGVTFTAIFLMMNGRASFAFLGYAILVSTITRGFALRSFDEWSIFGVFIGVWLCSVSAGTLLVSFLFSGLGALILARSANIPAQIKRNVSIALLLVCLVFGYFVFLSIAAIFEHFGTLEKLKSHGFGAHLSPSLILFSVAAIAAASWACWKYGYKLVDPTLLLAVSLPVIGGVFGYTTLTLAIVPIVCLLVTFAGRLFKTV